MPRLPSVLLVVWVALWILQAAAIRGAPAPRDGVALGIETVLADGEVLSWRGPYGREARVEGTGRFEVWRHPYWTGRPTVEGRRIVDRTPGWGEALAAGLAMRPVLHGLALVTLALSILARGNVLHATLLAALLQLPRALSPAWFLDSDPLRYHRSAIDLLEGSLPHPLWPPGWPAALAAAYTAAGVDPAVGRLLGAALTVALVPLVSVVARRELGPETALPAAVVTAISAEIVGFGPSLFAEPLFLVLSAALLATRDRPVVAGLLAAGAALTRAPGLVVAPLAFAAGRRGRVPFRFVAALLAPLLAWGAIRGVSGPDGVGMNLWIGHRPGATGDWADPWPEPEGGFARAAAAAIAADPPAAAGRVARNAGRLWSFSTSDRTLATRPLPLPLLPFGGLVLLAGIGLVRARPPPLVVWLLATTLVTAVFFAVVRYKLALYPALLPLAGGGIRAILDLVGRGLRGTRLL